MKIEGKNLLITGASRGIGLALAEAAAKRGGSLVLVSRSLSKSLSKNLLAMGAGQVTLWEEDLSSSAGVDRLASRIVQEKITIDVLVNNAGLLTGGLLEEQDANAIEKMLMVNLHAVIRLTHHLLPGMIARRSGIIVNNSSVSGKMFFPCASTYAASKAGVVAFTESLRQELEGTGVSTLLLITPGVKTGMYDDISTLYGKHMDLSFLTSIPAQAWAEEVMKSIEEDQTILWPKGRSRWGVKFAHHFPDLFSSLIKGKFRR